MNHSSFSQGETLKNLLNYFPNTAIFSFWKFSCGVWLIGPLVARIKLSKLKLIKGKGKNLKQAFWCHKPSFDIIISSIDTKIFLEVNFLLERCRKGFANSFKFVLFPREDFTTEKFRNVIKVNLRIYIGI